ncbi:MAG: hypothetical protein WCG84_02690 [Candidatus Moraniibacteriota bacterium]
MIQDTSPTATDTAAADSERAHKIQSLREMINNAEQTMQSAKAMLLQLEGKKKLGRKRKVEDIEDGSTIEGSFDGQIMLGNDNKHYPVPANYASKSKLVQGDTLKLTITPEGSFIYKQIGPAERKHAIGIVSQDETGNYFIVADNKAYRVLLASITYFKAEPGDEVAIVIPRDMEAAWCAIENIIQKASSLGWHSGGTIASTTNLIRPIVAPRPVTDMEHWKKDLAAPVQTTEESPVATEETIAKPDQEKEAPKKKKKKAAPVEQEALEKTENSADDTIAATPPKAETVNDEEAERLRQEIIDEWLKDSTPTAANQA